MKAVGLYKYLNIDDPESLIDLEIPRPRAEGHDILVKVKAVSVNPVDAKVRSPKDKIETLPKILGFDSAGIVEETGNEVSLFKKGDEVYYSGSIIRQGSNSKYQLVDERITGHKSKGLTFEEAAALPLTTITAWEGMFEQMCIPIDNPELKTDKYILIIGGAGGVGSIAIQLAKKLAGLKVIATASRKETSDWCKSLGADYVINHYNNFKDELNKSGIKEVDYVFCLNNTLQHFPNAVGVLKPFGRFCSIVGLGKDEMLDMNILRGKSASFSWELMFTKSTYKTADMISQHNLLNRTADLVEKGIIKTTMTENYGILNAANLRMAHAKIESGTTIGKIVLSAGW
jgi:zinc-binding alcohol dehydrogenase family protein